MTTGHRLWGPNNQPISTGNPLPARLYDSTGAVVDNGAGKLSVANSAVVSGPNVLAAAGSTINATTSYGNMDLSQYRSLTAFCKVTAFSGGSSPTIGMVLDISVDGGTTWVSGIAASSPATTASVADLILGINSGFMAGTIYRLRLNVTGTPTSVTFGLWWFAKS